MNRILLYTDASCVEYSLIIFKTNETPCTILTRLIQSVHLLNSDELMLLKCELMLLKCELILLKCELMILKCELMLCMYQNASKC